MIQEEKQLLLKDLSARLPYRVKITCFKNGALTPYLIDFRDSTIHATSDFSGTYIKVQLEDCKIYLRSLSSMTEEEKDELYDWGWVCEENNIYSDGSSDANNVYQNYQKDIQDVKWLIDWLLEHHFDYRGLIEKGLALEAPENMYK